MDERVNVVLFEPEIPQNTGNIMRTCVAAGCALHIIGPTGFDMSSATFKRATTNHITWADYEYYSSFADFKDKTDGGEFFLMTRYGKKAPSDIDFAGIPSDKKIYLVFGKESTGIPGEILRANMDRCFRIPMTADCRCLNISNAAAIAIYEVMRQIGYPGLAACEVQKGEDFLEDNYSYDQTLRFKR
ncbi:MAG: tRNA (cytidine(34)-2'-O)-methyltransferase [Saccharofermentans sp.]|nr:tRNA (cytidine(34)-2'-O)-methyltransferase [Saccharofermentans sp.]